MMDGETTQTPPSPVEPAPGPRSGLKDTSAAFRSTAVGGAPEEDLMPAATDAPVTRQTIALTGVLFFVLALGLVFANPVILFLGLFGFFLAVLGALVEAPTAPIVQRAISKKSMWVDEHVTVKWTVDVPHGTGSVFLHDSLPPEVEVVEGANIRLFWKGPARAQFTNSYTVRFPKRGTYDFPSMQWETRHPLDFRQPRRGIAADPQQVTVLPRILAIQRVRDVRGLAVTPFPMMDLARMGVATNDFREIREYVPGDPIRNINWKATARHSSGQMDNPLVNQFEMEGKKAIWLFFDSSSYMASGTTLRSPLEHAIEAASSLGFFYLTRGYHLGAHFSTRPRDVLYPDTGRQQFHRLTQQLLTLAPAGQSYDLAAATQACRAQLFRYKPRCIIVTRLDAEMAERQNGKWSAEFLRGVKSLSTYSRGRTRRVSVWVIAINGYSYAARENPIEDVAARLRALETRPIFQELRRAGVSVLEWDPFHEEFAEVLLRQLKLERSAV